MKKNTRSFIRKSICGVSALAIAGSMMVAPAFADVGGSEESTSGYVTCSAFAAATPAPEILGLTNMGWRSTDGTIGALDWSKPAFYIWGTSINSTPNPYYWNSVIRHAANNTSVVNSSGALTTIAAYSRENKSPAAAMKTYEASDANGKLVWETEPDIILGTSGMASGASYTDAAYAGAVSEVTGDTSYSPVGLSFSMSSNADIIDSMYNLAAAGDRVAANNSNKKLRYGSATTIAKELDEYYRGSQGYVLKQLAKDNKSQKTIVAVRGYDSSADTWTVQKTGAVNGTTSKDRTLETVQYVTKNLADDLSSDVDTMTTAQISKADCILITSDLTSGTEENDLVTALQGKGLIGKTFWHGVQNGNPGATFGTTHNSPENVQNYGRELGFIYPEYIDQDDMISYYFDHFYHITETALASTVQNAMAGVRNYDATGSDLTAWSASDTSTYNSSDVQDILKEGMAWLSQNKSTLEANNASTIEVDDNYGTVNTNTIGDATVSVSNATYTGKAVKPSVTVRLNGSTLSSSDYTVSYSNNKKVGKATVTVRGTGDYYGHVSKTFKINPKGTSLKKVTAKKKAFKATWKKQSTQTTGYQIRYSTKSSMKSAKTKTVSGKSKTSATVKSLKKGKKYYVQVRTYKKVSGTNYTSSWSGKKSVRTK